MAIPNRPANLRTEVLNTHVVNLYWDDQSWDETQFDIWRQHVLGQPPGGSDPGRIIGHVPPNTTFYQATQLYADSLYWFKVRSVNADGVSEWSDIASAFTPILPINTPPVAPINLTAELIADQYVDVRWEDLADNEDGYHIELSLNGTDYFLQETTYSSQIRIWTWRVRGLTASTNYWIRVKAFGWRGDSAPSNVVSFTTAAVISIPAAPSNLIITDVSHNAITVQFQDNASNEDKFRLQYSETNGATWGFNEFLDINETVFQFTDLTPGALYLFRVRAENAVGDSEYSNVVGATTLATPTIPIAPSHLRVTHIDVFAASIEWIDNSNNESRFFVEVSDDAGATWVNWDPQTILLGANTTVFTVGGIEPTAQVYHFRVYASNAAGNSAYSNVTNTTLLSLYTSYLTDTRITDNKAYPVTPIESGSYVLRGPVGEVTTTARWAFLQDGFTTAGQLETVTNTGEFPSDKRWSIRGLAGSVTADGFDGTTTYTLALNTFDNTKFGCGEVDLLLMALSPLPDITVNEPGIIPFSQQQPLGKMSDLTLTWTQGVISASQGTRCGGGQDCALVIISVYFKNTVNDQTLQYEICTYDSRGTYPDTSWFNSTGPLFFGVADGIGHYGDAQLGIGQTKEFVANICARVKALMSACPNPALDDDYDNWKINLLSVGPFVNGAAAISSMIALVGMQVQLSEIISPSFSVTSIDPSTGPLAGGTTVSIVGTGFTPGATVAIGGVAATSVTWVRDTMLTAVSGSHAAGDVNVVVTLTSGQSTTLTNGFEYTDDPGSGECDIPDNTVCWQVAGPLVTTPAGAFTTPGTVATIVDEHWEFTVSLAGTQLVVNSQVQVPHWQPKHIYWVGDSVRPSDADNHLRAVVTSLLWDEKKKTQDVPSGTSGHTEPTWPEEVGDRYTDNELEWTMHEDQWYKDGVLRFTSGANATLAKQFEVLLYEVNEAGTSARIRLVLPTPYAIQVGDEFIVEAGCDKSSMVCIYKYDNILNFGGEPHVPGFNRPHDTPTDESLN